MKYVTIILKLQLFSVFSLKDKRQIIKSITDQLNNKYNVAVAEISQNDRIHFATVGLVVVGNDFRYLESMSDQIIFGLDKDTRYELIDIIKEFHQEPL